MPILPVAMENPDIVVEDFSTDIQYESDQIEDSWESESTNVWENHIDNNDLEDRQKNLLGHKRLGYVLHESACKHEDSNIRRFWSPKVLDELMTLERIVEELNTYQADSSIGPLKTNDSVHALALTIRSHHRNIFVILTLLNKGQCIEQLIDEGIRDEHLPLIESMSQSRLYRRGRLRQEVSYFSKHWETYEREAFAKEQYRLMPIVLDMQPDGTVKHKTFNSRVVLPFVKQSGSGELEQGGYGVVKRVMVHPDCHRFQDVLQSIQTDDNFALKMLLQTPKQKQSEQTIAFWGEVEMLKRFTGFSHDHLVTLLMTWTINHQYYLLFPLAGCDLDQYWLKYPQPIVDFDNVRWISKQILGMTSALKSIHDPSSNTLHPPQECRYGKHGDLKPDNVLWYQSPTDERGILVLADLGLSTLNSILSRSNNSNNNMHFTPMYRSPECDLQGGKISRSYDIWTFGCLLLELVCWALGGQEARTEFSKDRMSPYLTGTCSDIFFDIQEKKGGGHVVLVKKQVTEHIAKLHEHENCSEYFHDLLYLIEEEMVVTLSVNKDRITAVDLFKRMERMHSKVTDYGSDYAKLHRRKSRPAVLYDPVDAVFKSRVRKGLQNTNLVIHKGTSQKAKSTQELEELDDDWVVIRDTELDGWNRNK
ncbi:kinase-like protein [Dothidotthia symphoricarpi CBS 119687]|uniref:Kinase-like protein n=1 Tax=Dothidotthia symphoricarpi CBS 119687 TaxID=1392245 RepID=A0A6A6AUS7_9PLEO|nr:kinase-like protein [Dothidotthia symphoricarpi CBS 119687]KAF2134963.1 kinase-like protein [Dothidotthia symphoricarpi CBS 119687]